MSFDDLKKKKKGESYADDDGENDDDDNDDETLWFQSRHTFARADLETVVQIPLCKSGADGHGRDDEDDNGDDRDQDRVGENDDHKSVKNVNSSRWWWW